MQSKTKLTDGVVARAVLPDGKSEAVIWDSEVTGFGLRLRGGARTYIVSYRPAGQGRAANMKRVRLGTPQTIRSVADARKLAFAMLGKVAAGGDPAKERNEEKRRKNARVSDLLDRYEKDLTRRRYVAVKMVMSLLRRRMKKHASKDIADLNGADYAAIIEALERKGQSGAAEEFRTRCRAFLAFCQVKVKVIEHNPLFGFRRQRATRADRLTKKEHGRALSDDELKAVWLAAKPATVFGRFVRFLILSGCRRGEGAGFAWPMIVGTDDNASKIVLPAVFVKQGRDHTVNVTPAVDELLALCVKDARSDLVFPSLRTGEQMSGWNKMKAGLVKESGVNFTFHDLRRTFRTGLTRLGIDSETAELALGHARENLIEIYERGGGAENVRKAFEAWSVHVAGVVAHYEPKPAEGVFA